MLTLSIKASQNIMKPHDFEDIYQRYLAVPAVHRWLNMREPVGRLGEYLRVEDPMLLRLGLKGKSERRVRTPQVGDLYLVHSICNGYALGIVCCLPRSIKFDGFECMRNELVGIIFF